jgi:hypothetical protein
MRTDGRKRLRHTTLVSWSLIHLSTAAGDAITSSSVCYVRQAETRDSISVEFYRYRTLDHPVFDAWWRLSMGVRIALDPTDVAIPSDCTLYYINQNQSQMLWSYALMSNSIVLNTTGTDYLNTVISHHIADHNYRRNITHQERLCYSRKGKTMFTSCDLTNSEVSIIHECGLQRLIYEIMTHGGRWIPHIHCWNRTLSIKSHTTASRFQSSGVWQSYIQHMVQNHRARSKVHGDERQLTRRSRQTKLQTKQSRVSVFGWMTYDLTSQ